MALGLPGCANYGSIENYCRLFILAIITRVCVCIMGCANIRTFRRMIYPRYLPKEGRELLIAEIKNDDRQLVIRV